jgi:hypothetical protein
MCFYITATLPKGTQISKLRNILDEYELELSQIDNSMLISQLRSGELYLRATKSYCDCDTVLGSLNSLQDFQNLSKSKKVKNLRKKKWSEEAIHKWINDRLKKKEEERRKKLNPTEVDLKINNWLNFLHRLLDNKTVSRIGLIKHWYTKDLANEVVKIKKK